MRGDLERDARFDETLRHVVDGLPRPAGESCPDAELLAAFLEAGLSPAERERVERHLAVCASCRETVGVAMRSAGDGQRAPVSRFPWLVPPAVRWLVPAGAAVAAGILFVFLVSGGPWGERPTTVPAGETLAENLPSPPTPLQPAGEQAARSGPASSQAFDRIRQPDRRPQGAPPEAERPSTVVPETLSPLTVVPPVAAALPGVEPASPNLLGRSEAAAAAEAPPPSAGAPEKPRAAPVEDLTASAAAKADKGAQGPESRVGAASRTARFGGAVAGGIGRGAPLAMRAEAPAGQAILVRAAAPGGTVVWEFDSGAIRRSADRGSTWQTESASYSGRVLAASSPSEGVCWAVGTAGLLMVNGGEGWQTRPFAQAVDLVAVNARDALHASVTTVEGRRFTTSDAGLTWTIVP